jgi:hypothetical protein
MRKVLLSTLFLLFSIPALSATLVLQPGAEGIDTYVSQDWHSFNFGYIELFINGQDSYGQAYNILIQWDLSALPTGATINDAVMALKCINFLGTPSGGEYYYMIIEPWDETTVTWDTKPLYSTSVQTSSDWPSDGEWVSASVTEFVRKWYNGTFSNYGIYISCQYVSGECYARFYSSDYISDPNARPKLIITYTPHDVVGETSLGEMKALFN